MRTKPLLPLLILFLFTCMKAGAQLDSILQKAKLKLTTEQIFVHTDKASYVAGETIWLKAYIMNEDYPSTKNSSILMQLIDQDSTVIVEKFYPIMSGIASGNIGLPVNLPEGRYFLRTLSDAVADHKMNRDLVMPLLIYNPSSALKITASSFAYTSEIKTQFKHPDALIDGLMNQVFISVKDQYQQPIETKGNLVNSNGDSLYAFQTDTYGNAELRFLPHDSLQYFIQIKDQPKTAIDMAIQQNGTLMNIEADKTNYYITISSNSNSKQNKFRLIALSDFHLLFDNKISLKNNERKIAIPLSSLPAGIFKIVLLDENDKLIGERNLFSNNKGGIIPVDQNSIHVSKTEEGESKISFQIKDSSDATFSMGGSNKDLELKDVYQPDNIVNRFLLTAYLRSYNPLFSGIITDLETADIFSINRILATETLLKPSWNEIVTAGQHAAIVEKDSADYIKFNGTVKLTSNKSFPKDPELNLIFQSMDSYKTYMNVPVTVSGNTGKFTISGLIFYDMVTVFYKLNSKKFIPVQLDVSLDDIKKPFAASAGRYDFLRNYPGQVLSKLTNPANELVQRNIYKNIINSDSFVTDLPNVTVTTVKSFRQKTLDVNSKYTSPLFSRDANQTYDLVSEPYASTTISVGKYLEMYGRQMKVVLDAQDHNNVSAIYKMPVLWSQQFFNIFIDEGRADAQELNNLFIENVALIKVFDNFLLGDEGGPAIAIYTKYPSDYMVRDQTTIQKIKIAGYSWPMFFVNPEKEDLKTVNKKNYQTSFYWNPLLVLNADKKELTARFYNINKVNTARLTIQGMNSSGKLFYFSKTVNAE